MRYTGLVAWRRVGSSLTRDGTLILCIRRPIPVQKAVRALFLVEGRLWECWHAIAEGLLILPPVVKWGRLRDASKASPPPPWAHHDGPESCQLFLDASCRLQGSLCFSLAHSDISTLHSTFPTKLKRPFSLLTPSIPSHAYSTAELLTV